jgi:hypothetical protein
LTSFNSSGFTIGTLAKINTASATYVGWAWDESITNGLDIVGYAGDGNSGRTISHSLGVAPKMIIVKSKSIASDWVMYHSSLTASNLIFPHLPNAQGAISSFAWGGVSSVSSTTFTVIAGNTDIRNVNKSGDNYVAYCFAEVDGFSKFGSYTGNGSTDGSFVWCGFRPRYVLVKRTDSTGAWIVKDTARDTGNQAVRNLYTHLTNAEDTFATVEWDILSNGFKLRGTAADQNASGGTYLFASFAEAPFKYARAR